MWLIEKKTLFPFDILISDIETHEYLANLVFIIYIMIKTLIDIIFTIFMISRFAKNQNSEYFYIINQILFDLAWTY